MTAQRRRPKAKRSRSRTKRKPYFRARRPPANRVVMGLSAFLEAIRHVLTGGESTWGPARQAAHRTPLPRCSGCGQQLDQSHDFRDHLPHAEKDIRP